MEHIPRENTAEMTSLSPQMAMTIDCDKLLSVPSGCLTPLPPTVNFQYAAKADYQEDDSQETPKRDPGQLAHLVTATDLHEKLTHLAEKQNFFEAGHVDLGSWTEDFVKVPLPQATSDVLTILPPPPAPHAVPRGEYRKHRTAIVSKGSVGHPLNCAAACKYVKRKGGCRDGADCPNCHECFWSKATAKESAERKEATPSAPGSQEDLVEKVVRLLQEESHQVPPKMAQAPEINFLGDYGPGFVDYLGVQIPRTTDTTERRVAGGIPHEPMPCNPGSMGHPYSCGPACKYVLKQKGCKDGDLCSHCHICRWTRYAAKHQLKL